MFGDLPKSISIFIFLVLRWFFGFCCIFLFDLENYWVEFQELFKLSQTAQL